MADAVWPLAHGEDLGGTRVRSACHCPGGVLVLTVEGSSLSERLWVCAHYLSPSLGWLLPRARKYTQKCEEAGLPCSVCCSVSLAAPVTSVVAQNPGRSQSWCPEGLGLSPRWDVLLTPHSSMDPLPYPGGLVPRNPRSYQGDWVGRRLLLECMEEPWGFRGQVG